MLAVWFVLVFAGCGIIALLVVRYVFAPRTVHYPLLDCDGTPGECLACTNGAQVVMYDRTQRIPDPDSDGYYSTCNCCAGTGRH